MQLTSYTDYGLRILIYLALLPTGKRASIDTVSNVYDIPRNSVNKIVHQLGQTHVIATKRGKGGGFFLMLPPEKINIGEMVLLLESRLEIIDCNNQNCNILSSCKLNVAFNRAKLSFVNTLKEYTLADLISGVREDLIDVLQIDDHHNISPRR